MTYKLWDALGVTPIRYHYYQPIPRLDQVPDRSWQRDRLGGIDLNENGQLSLLAELRYQEELLGFPIGDPGGSAQFFHNNSTFGSGDAEIFYSMIRRFRPKRILEIGGGYSTLIAHLAIQANGGSTEHICVEPYENPWLERAGLTKVIRSRLEE